MKDLILARRSVKINSPAVSTLAATKLFIDCFLFISWTTEGIDYRVIISGRCHFLVIVVLLHSQPVSSTGKQRFRNYYAVYATTEIPFTIGIVYDTYTHSYHGCMQTACAYTDMRMSRIGARLSRHVSCGGFTCYPSSMSNLFVCIGMSLCRLIYTRRVGYTYIYTKLRVYMHILLVASRGFLIARTCATHDTIRYSRISILIQFQTILFNIT